ncbi:EXO5 isoform 5, partial [Pan troglodytes]
MAETREEETVSAEASGFSDLSDSEFLEFLDLEDAQESKALVNTPGPSSESLGKDDKPISLQNWKRGLDILSPMERFHLKYLYVTDLATQNWCELQTAYGK